MSSRLFGVKPPAQRFVLPLGTLPWKPALAVTLGALAVEGALLGIFAPALPVAALRALVESRLLWEALHSAAYFVAFAVLLPAALRLEGPPLGPMAGGFAAQVLAAGAVRLTLSAGSEIIPCLHIGDLILLYWLWPRKTGVRARWTITLLGVLAVFVVATERHSAADVLLGGFFGVLIAGFVGPASAVPLSLRVARAVRRHERLATGAGLALLLSAGFYATDFMMARDFESGRSFWSPASRWDARVPFSPVWVWPYLFYFPFCAAPLLCRKLQEDIVAFRAVAAGYTLQVAMAMLIFLTFPSRMVRPDFDPVGLSAKALALFYKIDPGFNVFPSLHVAHAVFAACVIGRWAAAPWSAAAWLACALIAASTVLVKQHYLVDLPAGALLGLLCFHLIFRFVGRTSGSLSG